MIRNLISLNFIPKSIAIAGCTEMIPLDVSLLLVCSKLSQMISELHANDF